MAGEWTNDKELNIRTKLGLRLLMMMFAIVAPYQFGKNFETEMGAIKKILDEA